MSDIKTYYTHFEKIILNSIDLEPYEIKTENLFETFKEVYNIFLSEYVRKNNENKCKIWLFKEWLQGLPSVLSVEYRNHKILNNALLNGIDVSTEDKEDIFLEDYFLNLSNAFFTLKNNL